ncbi:MAG TPA: NUDIX hydrolase [Nocardioidaceae bacterium]|nr:NUDIX hydrolase [Nocardioidaceae bacterium]
MEPKRTVLAAGAVVWRRHGDSVELLVVHRPKYDDWTFPKGKVNRGERLPVTAVREVLEETTVPIRLGLPLSTVSYRMGKPKDVTKQVSYWIGRPIGDGAITLEPNHEIDKARWIAIDDVGSLLTYDHDRGLLDEFVDLRRRKAHKARPLIVLRHTAARSRTRWKGDDQRRTLTAGGLREAQRLVPLLQAFGITHVVSSDAARCVQSVVPYADHLDVDIVLDADLTEERATRRRVAARMRALLVGKRPTVVCTHRPVLPLVFEALGVPPVPLEPSQLMVVHRRSGRVLGTELHRA